MPIQIVDDFGAWDDLGVITPSFEEWVRFPNSTFSYSSVTRLVFSGDLTNPNSYAYLRCVYVVGLTEMVGRWQRIYPKREQEIIEYEHPQEFGVLKTNPTRFFEVQKRHYRRQRVGTHIGSVWKIGVHICNENLNDLEITEEEELLITGFL